MAEPRNWQVLRRNCRLCVTGIDHDWHPIGTNPEQDLVPNMVPMPSMQAGPQVNIPPELSQCLIGQGQAPGPLMVEWYLAYYVLGQTIGRIAAGYLENEYVEGQHNSREHWYDACSYLRGFNYALKL